MAANRKSLKFLSPFFVSILLIFVLSQNSLSEIYEWEYFFKTFKENTGLICRHKPAHIKVYLPKILKNYESITLVALIETDPTRIQNRHYLILNT